jgi:two-component system, OmpR family, KDP operon response regulator KdpE
MRRKPIICVCILAQLRRKLEDDPSHPVHLLTEAGMGYRFQQ